MGIFDKFWLFLRCPLTKYGYVTGPISKIVHSVLILHLILGQVTKFLAEKLSTSEVISKTPHGREGGGGVENTSSAFRVN